MRVADLYKILDDEFTVSIAETNENNTKDAHLVFIGFFGNAQVKLMEKEIKEITYFAPAHFRIRI